MVEEKKIDVGLLGERLSEKTQTEITIISVPKIFDYEIYVRVKDFERSIVMVAFLGLVSLSLSLIL